MDAVVAAEVSIAVDIVVVVDLDIAVMVVFNVVVNPAVETDSHKSRHNRGRSRCR